MVSLSDEKNIRGIYFTKKKYDDYILWDDYPWYANEGYSSKGKKRTTNDTFVIGIAFIGFNRLY